MRSRIYSCLAQRPWQNQQRLAVWRQFPASQHFHTTPRVHILKPFLLADIGEGIRECEIIQWFVEPGARVEEWDKLCEVQSDKASVEITSRFAGVIKKLHYDAGEMAKVGKPLMDIDIQGDVKQEDLDALTAPSEGESQSQMKDIPEEASAEFVTSPSPPAPESTPAPRGKHATLATPAVRHLTKELNVKIEEVTGTGKDGRVMKDDVYQFAKARDTPHSTSPSSSSQTYTSPSEASAHTESVIQLSQTQLAMFKTMTKSLSIPHFLYADEIDFSALSALRLRLNKGLANTPINEVNKLSFLPFIIKAVSMALHRYPILNARVDVDSATQKPTLVMRNQHNIGIAMDTPSGLIVPVIKNVSSLTILSIASEIARLQLLASTGKLTSQDLSGGTITVSNIGSIGGTYVSPVIVEKEVAILGIGKVRVVPAFGKDEHIVRKPIANFSWSADHRVVDGATMARAAECVRGFVEDPDSMVMHLR